jgi:ATP-dependent Lon protease
MVTESQQLQPHMPAIAESLPVLPVRGMVLFPMAIAPLVVGQPRSVRLVDDVMRGDRMLALVAHQVEGVEQPGPEHLPRMGTAAIIHQLVRRSDGTLGLALQGIERIRIVEYTATEPYLVARVQPVPELEAAGVEIEGLRQAVADLFKQLVSLATELSNEMASAVDELRNPRQVAYFVAASAPLDMLVRQELLELESVDAKLRRLAELLQHELAVREIGQRITAETQKEMTKAQREYFLREQLKAIQRELGEGVEVPEVEQLRQKLDEVGLPEEARREAERELSRLASLPPASPEHGIIMTYLDWMANLPWNQLTGSTIDVRLARRVLDEDHYDLEKIKDRIVEYLAVKKLRQERLADLEVSGGTPAEKLAEEVTREPILCFVGPPGVGKTSLGHSIARALGRKFIRISLGGVHDEAEIRGHRRTYIGALPGRIIQSIRRSGARDPVFMLDEVDKVRSDWRGDPSSALLEVLDPAQNHAFMDNYLGVPFDLSQVLFITTANTLDTIPAPLLDRMEVLQLSGYTDEEKVAIAQQYLIPKQLAAHALKAEELSFDADSIRAVIRGYTREAGVRNLDRELATICRKVASEVAEGRKGAVQITREQVNAYLGRPRFYDEAAERTERPGVAIGLAWTPTGGDVLFVEATLMADHEGRLILTGMLGDVMRESAQAALSYVRSNAERLGVAPGVFEEKTVHLHVPAGAIPKDGPSAGVTMATALTSVATNRCVRHSVAMTGEITLRGRVLPVGGIREKVLAAHRAGIRTMILPRRNELDLEDVPADLRRELNIILVDTVDQVLEQALEPLAAPEVTITAGE